MTKWMREFFEFWAIGGLGDHPAKDVPGEVILHLPSEKREQLKQLKSEDLAQIRPDTIHINGRYLTPEQASRAWQNHLVKIKRRMIPLMARPDFYPDSLEDRDAIYLRRIIEDEIR